MVKGHVADIKVQSPTTPLPHIAISCFHKNEGCIPN